MRPPHLITLTSDFGEGSHYVAQVKGVLLGMNPGLQLVDLTHSVPPQQVRQAAFLLQQSVPAFPDDTCHIAVVDPGVGTDRRIVLARIQAQYFIAPDNGLLFALAQRATPEWVLELTEAAYWRNRPRRTFHARDIMAPVAAHLSLGIEPQAMGRPIGQLTSDGAPAVVERSRELIGTVSLVDRFGNLITDIDETRLARIPTTAEIRVGCGLHEVTGMAHTYAERPAGTLIALVGSGGFLELAQVNGHAAHTVGAQPGDIVTVRW